MSAKTHAFLFLEKRGLYVMEPMIVTKFLCCFLLKKPTPTLLKKKPQAPNIYSSRKISVH